MSERAASAGPARSAAAPRAARNRGGRPPRITKDDVVQAGLEVGLADLTLKAVADHLGVSTPGLYTYVADRDELIALVGEQILAAAPIPPNDGRPWDLWAYDMALMLRATLESAPGFADVAISKSYAMPTLVKRYEAMLEVAVQSGFDHATAMWLTRGVTEFVQSWVSRREHQLSAERDTGRSYWSNMRRAVSGAGARRYPTVAKTLKEPLALDLDRRFEFTLRALIDGLNAAAQSQRSSR